jgi:hypothetical protein
MQTNGKTQQGDLKTGPVTDDLLGLTGVHLSDDTAKRRSPEKIYSKDQYNFVQGKSAFGTP